MSRRQNAAAQKLAAEQILYAQQCQFWSRSLERNDADMAAVIDLNRSLHAVRSAFVKNNSNGDNDEILLLDLGLGRYRLAPDGRDILLKATEVVDDDDDAVEAHNENQDQPGNDSKDDEVPQHTTTNNKSSTTPPHPPTTKKKMVRLECILESELSAEKQELCVDFLLRKKLRRKLLSRIARRLNRLASSMDGEAVVLPPPGAPPKYGDLRLHCDEAAVQAFAQLKQRQDEAWTRIQAVREDEYLRAFLTTTATTTTKRPLPPPPATGEIVAEKEVDDDSKQEEDDTMAVEIESDAVVVKSGEETLNVATEGSSVVENAEPTLIATEEMQMETAESDNMVTEDLPLPAPDTSVPPDTAPSSSRIKADAMDAEPNTVEEDEDEPHDPLAADYALLRDYKDAYEKVVDSLAVTDKSSPATATTTAAAAAVKYTILQQPHVEDYVAIKLGTGGIGATHHSMSAKEKELEFLRWQSSLLARIPEQPTYAELGLEHRVFYEKERRQHALQKMKEREEEAESQAMKGAYQRPEEDSSSEEDSDDGVVSKEETAQTKGQHSDDDKSNSGSDEDTEIETTNEVVKSTTSESGDDEASTKDIALEGVNQVTDSLQEHEAEATAVVKQHSPTEGDAGSLKIAASVDEKDEEVAKSFSKLDDCDGNMESAEVHSVDDQPPNPEQVVAMKYADDPPPDPKQVVAMEIADDPPPNPKQVVVMEIADDQSPNPKQVVVMEIADDQSPDPEQVVAMKSADDQSPDPEQKSGITVKDDWVLVDKMDPGVDEFTETDENGQMKQSVKDDDMDVSDNAAEMEVVHSDNDGIKLPEKKGKEGTDDKGERNKKTKSPSKDQKENAGESKKEKDAVEENQVETEAPPVAPKVLKPMSLTAIPSFYEQDMKRMKLVHADLMSSSIREHAVRRLEEATRDYNLALKNSSELVEHRTYLQNHINALTFDVRNQMHIVNADYSAQVAIATNRWKTSRLQFENNRLNQILPSRNGRIPTGTQMTLNYKIRPNRSGICEAVGNCLADIVDCVEGIAQGLIRSDRFAEPFTLPPPPTGVEADNLQRNKQLETTKRNELNAITLRLRTSEGDRLRAWRKMLKTKAEFDIPHHHQSSNGAVRVIQLDQNTCSTMPLPTLHQSATQRVPNEFAAGRSIVASYTPSHAAPSIPVNLTTADSKYSTDRVRDRIAADGTVAPVTKPKMTKEGLYQRPAGRTRKGMEWDAVRGIWIPAPESKSGDRES